MIYLVGLGPGAAERLPAPTFSLLTGELPVYLRTARHPIVESGPLATALQEKQAPVTTFDSLYDAADDFASVYTEIVRRVLDAAAGLADIVYAVPGHPLVGESTTALLLPLAKERNIPMRVIGAPSFVEACLEAVGASVTGDLAVVDALTLDPAAPTSAPLLRGENPILLYQVHDRSAASNAKLALMRAGFPDDFLVTEITAAGLPDQERVRTLSLWALDREASQSHLTSIFVPALPADQRRPGYDELLRVMARLRGPGGCPWDHEQTHQTLRPYVLEEAYEVAEAIDQNDPEALCEELGDLLLQVVFHAEIARADAVFDESDVCAGIVEKLIRRHPHVFGDVTVSGSGDVLTHWEEIKKAEKAAAQLADSSVLDNVPRALPALSRALQISKRAVKTGFEWDSTAHVLEKVDEELEELRQEIQQESSRERIADELGDLLFTLVNVARRLGIDPEVALQRQMQRFERRFRHLEQGAGARGVTVGALPGNERLALWREAKEKYG